MKYLVGAILMASFFISCKNQNSKIVSKVYVDSLINHYTLPQQAKDNEADLEFWKSRIDPKQSRQVNESKYASTLIARFHLFGDIQDVKQAEAIYKNINKTYNSSLASPFVALTSSAMLQHHFSQADTLLEKAKKIGVDNFTLYTLSFDVNFELGRYIKSSLYLNSLKSDKDYSYYFRRSKYDHFNGTIDSAISGMMQAAKLAKASPYLKGIALSNAADLNIHAGKLQKAGEIYKECLRLNSADFHSILGLGWLTLVHDKNDTLAERLFKFVLTKNKLPDPLFKLYQMAQERGDKSLEKRYANEFVAKSTDTVYGQMYNKYVIEIYTGILNNPSKAEDLAKNELNNRATPQTYAWYAYTLFENNKKDEAYKVFQQHVSGQPLEGLELYYMGKMMKGLGKGYNAGEFFKAAEKNKYDLSPDQEKDLQKSLEE
ncbi:tetratricopeptide repeat protein [Mucilaginibacter sp. OK098]|uniref:tetratricopeptide repeat protein n=1 Tax=Mucilaginibacter sp. OK098 TaxID=1855297 RepID=UPI000923E8E8|nr:hypothetical protein [Mucilaginibacter sp. OK098]SHM01728.1 hypothetical protein SAMN05216524_101534 [Mucilaginibacter sp. OK098]